MAIKYIILNYVLILNEKIYYEQSYEVQHFLSHSNPKTLRFFYGKKRLAVFYVAIRFTLKSIV